MPFMHIERIPIYMTESSVLPQACEHSESHFILIQNPELLKSCFIYINLSLHKVQKCFKI